MHIRSAVGITLIAALTAFACGKEKPVATAPETAVQTVTAVVKAEKAHPVKTASDKTISKAPYVKKDTYFKLPAVAGGEIDLATDAIYKVEREAHLSGLTESIKQYLESKTTTKTKSE